MLLILHVHTWAQGIGATADIQSDLLFPPVKQHVHGSTIVGLPNGDLLVAWYQGSGERTADDVKVFGARWPKGAKGWTAPFLMADAHDMPDCNPVMFLDRRGTLHLTWITVLGDHWESSILRHRTATDLSGTGAPKWAWQDDIFFKPDDRFATETAACFKELPGSPAGWSGFAPEYDGQIINASRDPQKRGIGWMPRIKPLQLPGGRILLPLYSDGFNFSLIGISDDQGETWKPSLPLIGRGNVQPALVQKKDGTIVAFQRDNGDEPGRIQVSESRDTGMSWTAAKKTDMPNPGSSVEALVLEDGRWMLVINDTEQGRHRLSMLLSKDEGATWPVKKTLVETEKGKGSFSYPALIQTQDGMLHLTYSWNMEGQGETIAHIALDPKELN
jgi:predicted neuraminidase